MRGYSFRLYSALENFSAANISKSCRWPELELTEGSSDILYIAINLGYNEVAYHIHKKHFVINRGLLQREKAKHRFWEKYKSNTKKRSLQPLNKSETLYFKLLLRLFESGQGKQSRISSKSCVFRHIWIKHVCLQKTYVHMNHLLQAEFRYDPAHAKVYCTRLV